MSILLDWQKTLARLCTVSEEEAAKNLQDYEAAFVNGNTELRRQWNDNTQTDNKLSKKAKETKLMEIYVVTLLVSMPSHMNSTLINN